VALDNNVLVYAEGVNGASMKAKAIDVISTLSDRTAVLPVQALGELFHVLVRRAGRWRPGRAC
jgi:predicted nucleic acid-binding protein